MQKLFHVSTLPVENNVRDYWSKQKIKLLKEFTIITTPESHTLNITSVNRYGEGGKVSINLSKELSELKKMQSSGDWMTNYKNNEVKLKETITSDTKGPLISLQNIRNNQFVDTYNFFVRGKVTDDKGVISILVNGKKI